MTKLRDSWRWGENRVWVGPSEPMSMLELVGAGSLDLKLASLLWLFMEKRASVIVAALPQLAGKTTYLTALLDFLPPHILVIPTLGTAEDFSFLDQTEPQNTYILVSELSDHMPRYMWGEPARKLFSVLEKGYAVGATMHAMEPQDLFYELAGYPLFIPPQRLGLLHFYLMLDVVREGSRIVRRVGSLGFVPKEKPLDKEISLLTLAYWDSEKRSLVYNETPEALGAVADRFSISTDELLDEWRRHQVALTRFWKRGIRISKDLREAVQGFYAKSTG